MLFLKSHFTVIILTLSLCPWDVSFLILRSISFEEFSWRLSKHCVSRNAGLDLSTGSDEGGKVPAFQPLCTGLTSTS